MFVPFFYFILFIVAFHRVGTYSPKRIRELVERGKLAAHTSPSWSYGAVGVVGQCAFRCFQGVVLEEGLT